MTNKDEIDVGTKPSEEELFYCQIADQIIKDTLPFLNQVLRQLVTLSAALLAGSIAVLDKGMIEKASVAGGMVFLLISLTIALIGILPYGGTIVRRTPGRILLAVQSGIRFKSRLSWASAACMVLALFVITVGILTKKP